MEKIIKISSEQGSFDTSGTKNLCDFIIPASGDVIDLSESHISINYNLARRNNNIAAAVYNNFLNINDAGTDNLERENVGLVRNVEMVSSKFGMIESIKDVNKLRENLKQYEQSVAEKDGRDMGSTSSRNFRSTYKPQPSTELYSFGDELSRERDASLKLPLKDLMNSCKMSSYPTDGNSTRLHLEFELQRLQGGTETINNFDTLSYQGDGVLFKTMDDANGGAAIAAPINQVTTTAEYADLVDSPWYTNMPVTISANDGGAGAAPIAGTNRILSIARNAGDDKLVLTLETAIGTGGNTLTDIEVVIDGAGIAAPTITINKIELVAKVNPAPEKLPMVYSTYIAQNDSYGAVQNVSRNYDIPPLCKNVYIMFDTHVNSVEDNLQSYRLYVDNEALTNRDVRVNSPLHYELVSRVFQNNNSRVHNLTERVNNVFTAFRRNAGNEAAGSIAPKVIMAPVPFKQVPQRLVVELNGSGNLVGRHVVFMEVMRSK